jgi:hypothetical protein
LKQTDRAIGAFKLQGKVTQDERETLCSALERAAKNVKAAILVKNPGPQTLPGRNSQSLRSGPEVPTPLKIVYHLPHQLVLRTLRIVKLAWQ